MSELIKENPEMPGAESVADEPEIAGDAVASEELSAGTDNDTEKDTEKDTDSETATSQKSGMPEMAPPLFVVCFVICIFATSIISYHYGYQKSEYDAQIEALKDIRDDDTSGDDEIDIEIENELGDESEDETAKGHEQTLPDAEMLHSMSQLYELNSDTIGWLTIKDTNIDYPVMQSMQDEEYYLDRDFNKEYNANGCLIMDTDSVVGSGTKDNDYADGTLPSTNLIIHGHHMKNGEMFGNLDKYKDVKYFKDHRIIEFSSLYEKREYEVCAVFLSQVYLKTQTDVFKFYNFFQADTEEEFNDFYDNIKELSLYDTGVNAKFGDEFITLSVCAYHVENGRLVVVGKRIK